MSIPAGYPFDLIKTRMQAFRYPSNWACVREIYTQDGGLVGFFRGIGPILLTVSVLRSLSFSIYTGTKPTPDSVVVISSVLAGSAAGSIVATVNAPIEFIKIQRQLDSKMRASVVSSSNLEKITFHRSLSAWEWARKIVRQKGVIGLWSGYSFHLARDFTGTGMYFGGYESLKVLFTPKGEIAGPMVHMMAGGLSGTLSWIVLYPIDLIKSVMQKEALQPIPKYSSANEFIRRRFRKGGVGGFYHGIGAQLMRSFPVHAMNFLVYEAVKEWALR
ncbi:mitochondrial carrier domain-containing protein [Chytriomyces sp. MP71]|nr:mitochondrial carrier domain-containing protein [Chytriomyces sp. MP71]